MRPLAGRSRSTPPRASESLRASSSLRLKNGCAQDDTIENRIPKIFELSQPKIGRLLLLAQLAGDFGNDFGPEVGEHAVHDAGNLRWVVCFGAGG